jgi:tetratricopeptide (TPR) repeat protein
MNPFRTAATAARLAASNPIQAALALRAEGRLEEALQALSRPGEFNADFYILRGDLQLELGQLQDAAASYSSVARVDPDHIYAQGQLGLCLHSLERWEPAAHAFEAVLQFDPHRDEVRLKLADCLLRLERYGTALECFDKCWSEASRRRALFGKALALQLLRRFDEAEKHYEHLLRIDPAAEEALSNLIAMSMEVFELARVQKYSQRLLELNSRSSAALKGLALAAIERHDDHTAARYFYQLAEVDPGVARRPEERSDAAEYRISRRVFESLEEIRRKQTSRAAHVSSAALPR